MQTCKTCGHQVNSDDQYCPNCGRRLDQYSSVIQQPHPQNQPFSEQTPPFVAKRDDSATRVLCILLLIFFYPAGLLYMWLLRPFTKKTRWVITLAFFFTILFGFIMIIWWTTLPGYLYLALI